MKRVALFTIIGLVVLLFVGMKFFAQEKKVTIDQVPEKVKAAILKEVADGTLVDIGEFTEGGKKTYEIEMLTSDGKEYDVMFSADGKVLKKTFEGTTSSQEGKIELEEAHFYIEYNYSARDAGVQVFLDGDEWAWIEIVDPRGKKIYRVNTDNNAKQIGITELFFESSEPSFDELPFEELLALYPEGEYKFIGKTVEGDDIEGEAIFTHTVPKGPVVSPTAGTVTDPNNTVISWQPVTEPQGINIVSYEVIVEREDPLRVFDISNLPPSTTKVTVSEEFLEYDTDYKFEVLAKEASGNQTITEGSFKTMAAKR